MRGDPNRNLVAAISYLLGFITGVVVLFTEDRDKFIRFHAMQSTIATGALFLLNILVGLVLGKVSFLGILADIFGVLVWFLILAICIAGFVWAWQGKVFKLPLVGQIAEKRIGKQNF